MPPKTVYEAFDEFKTPKEWSEDKRCIVSYVVLLGRISRGWPMEAALVLTPKEARTIHVAFGLRKDLIHWLTDSRCAVPASILKKRIKKGWDFEKALTKPEDGYDPNPVPERRKKRVVPEDNKRKYLAFGERKTLQEWGIDKRSVRNGRNIAILRRMGLPLEAAIIFPHNDLEQYHWCFGKLRKLGYWIRHKGCIASPMVLKGRLDGGEKLEEAMTRPDNARPPRPKAEKATKTKEDKLKKEMGINELTIGNVTKTIHAWTQEPECEITSAVLADRIRKNWPINKKILKLSTRHSPFKNQFGAYNSRGKELGRFRTKKLAADHILATVGKGTVKQMHGLFEWAIPEEKKEPRPKLVRYIKAWGVTKSGPEWMFDHRSKVGSVQVLYRRLDAKKRHWTPEEALSTPPAKVFMSEFKKLRARTYPAFGENKTLIEWSKHPECEVPFTTLKMRVQRGVPVELALKREIVGYSRAAHSKLSMAQASKRSGKKFKNAYRQLAK